MSKLEKEAILNKIDRIEKQLDNWDFYKNPVGIELLKEELCKLYKKLPKP